MAKYLKYGLLATAMLAVSSGAVASETDRLMELLIEKQILTQQEADAIRSEAKVERKPLIGQEFGYEPTAPLPVDEGAEVFVRRLGVETADGSERFRIRGRVQLDAAWQDFGDDIPNVAREGNDFADYGVIFRRLRLGALGLMREKFEWQIELDFAEDAVEIDNTYMAYLMDHGGRLAAGLFKEPFTMEYSTSSRYITFMERSAAVDAYKVSKEPGIMYETIKPNYYVGVGIFGSGIEFERSVEEGYSFAGRASFAPYLSGTDFVHIGGGINYRKNALDKSTDLYRPLRLRTREGTRAIDARLIGRDDLEGVEDFTRYNLEFAAGVGSWWVQAEYLTVDIDLDRERLEAALGGNATAENSLTQDGWYLYTGYYLTGESKPYRAFSGDYGALRPNANFSPSQGTWGAFEVAFGYSVADSLEHTRPGRGQKQDRYVLGLNWFLTPEVMVKFNVIYLEGERDIFEDDGWVYGVRGQYFF